MNEEPAVEAAPIGLRVLDLFAGCGGFSLGLTQAVRNQKKKTKQICC
jgi:tRNA G37 N-methylase Trm5